MPDGLAEAAYEVIHGRFTDDERKGVFGPEVASPASASAQDKLLAYTAATHPVERASQLKQRRLDDRATHRARACLVPTPG